MVVVALVCMCLGKNFRFFSFQNCHHTVCRNPSAGKSRLTLLKRGGRKGFLETANKHLCEIAFSPSHTGKATKKNITTAEEGKAAYL